MIARMMGLLESVRIEVRIARRSLLRRPVLGAAAVLAMGLGVGGASAVYSVVDGVLLRPLPYSSPNRLVWLDHAAPGIGSEGGLDMTPGLYEHYRSRSRLLSGIGIFDEFEGNVSGSIDPMRVHVTRATPSFFEVLGLQPAEGRFLQQRDDYSSQSGAAVLSYGFWLRVFGGAVDVVGESLNINGFPHEIVGIMPRDFVPLSGPVDLWIPYLAQPGRFGGFTVHGVGRLVDGATIDGLRAELLGLIPSLVEAFPSPGTRNVVESARLEPRPQMLHDHLTGGVRAGLWVAFGAAGLVLLIACVNVAGLLLVRAESRRLETALRSALGAGRGRLAISSFAESLLIGVGGAAAGVGLAITGVRALTAIAPSTFPRIGDVSVNGAVVVFASLAALAAAALAGLIAVRRREPSPAGQLASGVRSMVRPGRHGGGLAVLVAAQIAVSTVLLVGSGLMIRTYSNLRAVDSGFDPTGVLTFSLGLSPGEFADRGALVAAHNQLIERVRGLPGVRSVSAVTCPPFVVGCRGGNPLAVRGRPLAQGETPPVVRMETVGEDYFATMGIGVLRGRPITRDDINGRTGAVVVDETLAQLYWPDGDAIGQRVHPNYLEAEPPWYTVVGVVGSVRAENPGLPAEPTIYMPLLGPDDAARSPTTLYYVVRSDGPPLALVAPIRAAIQGVRPELPLADVGAMTDVVARATAPVSFTLNLLLAAALAALLLSVVGTYGVVAYTTGQRRGEIGLRLALGARRLQVLGMVLGQGSRIAMLGLVAGIGGAVFATRFLQSFLYGVESVDLVTYAGAAFVLVLASLVAILQPAARAARVDPVRAISQP